MKVVLRTDIDGVGRRGDIVNVSGGFARNFLLPQGSAIVATAGIEGQAESMRRARDLRTARDRDAAEAKAKQLAGAVVKVTARAGANGRLFGSVSAADVIDAVRQQKGVELDRAAVALDEPIKVVGTSELLVLLWDDVEVALTLEVVSQD